MNDTSFTISGKILDLMIQAFCFGFGLVVGYALVVFVGVTGYWLWAQYANARDRKIYEKSLEKPDVHTRDARTSGNDHFMGM